MNKALLIVISLLLAACATAPADNPPPAVVPTALGEEATTIDVPALAAPAEVADTADDSAVERHLKRAAEMANADGDIVGAKCWNRSLELYAKLTPNLGDLDGIAPKIEAERILRRALTGDVKEQWVVDCAPVYVELRMDARTFALRILTGSLVRRLFGI